MTRAGVRKTYKIFLGGAFARSESGRTYPIVGTDGELLAHAVAASRKDLRDAVAAARKAQAGWGARTGYNRGQILYRIAELMESRRSEFREELTRAGRVDADEEIDISIDRWVWYAGWCDKYPQILGGANPVAGPYFNFTTPEPVGVVGVIAAGESSLLPLVSRVAPLLVAGNSVVAIASRLQPLAAVVLAEVLATSDVPAGVVNILTGDPSQLAPWLTGHGDVDAVDLSGCDGGVRREAELMAADSVTRTFAASADERQWRSDAAQHPYLIAAGCEYKTVWHPKGR